MTKGTLYLDTEFNDFGGELISIALVGTDDREWYRSLGCNSPTPWVKNNVMPVLGIATTNVELVRAGLRQFLAKYSEVTIIADWPTDIEHFCRLLITGPGTCMATPPLNFVVDRSINSLESRIPHNALEDARALKISHVMNLFGAPARSIIPTFPDGADAIPRDLFPKDL